MTASKLNGAGWRLYRHINRYSNMSVLFGSNLSTLSAGQALAPASESPVSRFEEPHDQLENPANISNVHLGEGQTSSLIKRSPSSQTVQSIPASNRERPPTINRALTPIQPMQANMGPVTQTGVQRVEQAVPATPNNHFRPVVQPAAPALNPVGSSSAVQRNVQRVPTIAPTAHAANQQQPAQPTSTFTESNIQRTLPAPAIATQNIEPSTIRPTVQPSMPSEPSQLNRSVSQPSVQPMQPTAPTITPSGQTTQPVQPAQTSPTSATLKIDRAQQDRMGQIATHNPDVVKVPKNMSSTQVWNDLSRINDFHAAREPDDDPRTPWERKTVEKKVERPKKLLRKTAIEEVGRPSKKKNHAVAPTPNSESAQRSGSEGEGVSSLDESKAIGVDLGSTVQAVTDRSDGGINRFEAESSGSESAQTSTPQATMDASSTPSLEDVWPVQRLDEPSSMLQSADGDSDLANLDPPTRPLVNRQTDATADVQQFVNRVESAKSSDSSIDFVPPSRPRPQVKTKSRPVDPFVISRESESKPELSADSINAAQRDEAIAAPQDIQRDAYEVQTEVGPLPSDLWRLVGDQPPSQQSSNPVDALSGSQKLTSATPANDLAPETINRLDQSIEHTELARSETTPKGVDNGATHVDPISHQADAAPNSASHEAQRKEEPFAVSTKQAGEDSVSSNEQSSRIARFSTWESADYRPEAVNRRTELARQQPSNFRPSASAAESEPFSATKSIKPAPGSLRPVMRAEDDFDEVLNENDPSPATVSAPEFTEEPKNDFDTFPAVAVAESAMLFADSGAAEADGGSATAVEAATLETPQPVTLFADQDEMAQLMSQAEPKAADPIVPLYPDEDSANQKSEAPIAVSVTAESDDAITAQAFADESQISTLTVGGDSGQNDSGLTLYPDDESIVGNAVELKIKIDGGEELFIGFADGNQLSEFVDAAATSDEQPGLMLFSSEGGDGDGDFEPVPFLLQRQGEQELMIGFADGATVDAFLSEASEVDRGATALIYAEQEAADEDLENPSEVHFRSAEGDDVLLGYADTEALELMIQAADEVSPEQDLNELTQLVYGRLRHQLQVENERWRIH